MTKIDLTLLLALINDKIKTNAVNSITGDILNEVLGGSVYPSSTVGIFKTIKEIVDQIGDVTQLTEDTLADAIVARLSDAPSDGNTYARKDASWVSVGGAIDVSSVFGATPALPSGYTLATLQGKDLYAIVDSNRFHVTLKYDSTKSSGSQGLFYYTDVDWDGNVDIVKSIL